MPNNTIPAATNVFLSHNLVEAVSNVTVDSYWDSEAGEHIHTWHALVRTEQGRFGATFTDDFSEDLEIHWDQAA